MKTLYFTTLIICLLLWKNIYTQSPEGISYQAAARNNSGELILNQNISIRITIHDLTSSGPIVYQEMHSTVTNGFGLFSISIGLGTPSIGLFNSINWSEGNKFLQTEIDFSGVNNFIDMGTQQFLSVPYALFANKVNNQSSPATYRWATFDTYNEAMSWAFNNDATFFGGINPSNWTDNNATAAQLSSNKEVLRRLFTKKGYAKDNATIINENFIQYSSTNGRVTLALFRVKNTSSNPIVWSPSFYYSAHTSWGEIASVALNGANVFVNGTSGNTTLNLSIPPQRVSTVIFVSTSGIPHFVNPSFYVRTCRLAFYDNCLALPAGLSFVDDLDIATGGWEQ